MCMDAGWSQMWTHDDGSMRLVWQISFHSLRIQRASNPRGAAYVACSRVAWRIRFRPLDTHHTDTCTGVRHYAIVDGL